VASRFLVPFASGRSLLGRTDPFLDLHREVNQLFENAFRGSQSGVEGGSRSAMMSPRMDIHKRGDAIEITAELPGVSQNDLDLSIEGNVLTIRGEKRKEHKDEQAHVVERSYGSFQRSIQLAAPPDPSQIQASFKDGILTITVPNQAEQETSHRIEIRSGQDIQSSSAQTSSGEGQSGAESRPAIGGQGWATGGSKSGEATGDSPQSEGSSRAQDL
jgi:HSP20 family protein